MYYVITYRGGIGGQKRTIFAAFSTEKSIKGKGAEMPQNVIITLDF